MRKLSAFLEFVWNKKTWVILTSIFLFAVNTVRTYEELFERLIRNIQRAEMVQLEAKEEDWISEIFKMLNGFMSEYEPLLIIYDKYYGAKSLDQQPPEEVTKQAAALCMHLRLEAAKRIGSIRGMKLANPDFAQFRDNILESLQEMDALVVRFEEFFQGAQRGALDVKRDAAQQLTANFENTTARLKSAVGTSSKIVSRSLIQKAQELEFLTAEMKWLKIKFYLTIISIAYIVLYVFFVCRAYLQYRRIKSCVPMRK
jgi:hypothetical protein